jgi:hypothetical protein
VLEEHVAPAFARAGQEFPQDAQLATVPSGVSQPSAAEELQSRNPLLHEVIAHELALQEDEAFARLHALPHVPQFALLVRVSVSQPLAAFASQLPKFGRQVESWQTPAEQAAVPLANAHALMHEPQRFGSVFRFASHPFAGLPSQSAYGALQEPMAH